MPRRLAVSVVLEAPDGFGDVVYLAGDEVPDALAATVTNDEVWAEEPAEGQDDRPAPGGARRPPRAGHEPDVAGSGE